LNGFYLVKQMNTRNKLHTVYCDFNKSPIQEVLEFKTDNAIISAIKEMKTQVCI
jgi:hypothetical protein